MKPKKETDSNGQFAIEIIIHSQVIHKNIVKLIRCFLEVVKPILVYEFLLKGSSFLMKFLMEGTILQYVWIDVWILL